jgi:hypothetical protein
MDGDIKHYIRRSRYVSLAYNMFLSTNIVSENQPWLPTEVSKHGEDLRDMRNLTVSKYSTLGRFKLQTLAHDIIATRDIKMGEEILISCKLSLHSTELWLV